MSPTDADIEQMREALAADEWERLPERDLRDVLWAGCPGWGSLSPAEIIELHEELEVVLDARTPPGVSR